MNFTKKYAGDPNNKKELIIHLISEFWGIFLLNFFLIILTSVFINGKPLLTIIFPKGYDTILVFIYTLVLVGLLLLIFIRWSANFNPTISIYFYLIKACSKKYTMQKIAVQYLGGICSGALGWCLALLTSNNAIDTNAMGGFLSNNIASPFAINTINHIITAHVFAYIIEFFAAAGICYFLYSKHFKENYRAFGLTLYFAFGIAIAYNSGILAWNPARCFGPALFHDFQLIADHKLTPYNSELLIYWVFLLAPISGVYAYYYIDEKFGDKISYYTAKLAGLIKK